MRSVNSLDRPLSLSGLPADKLAEAALFYFKELPDQYDSNGNGYGAGINAQGDAVRFRQLALWLQLCAGQSFSDLPTDNQQSAKAFEDAAQFSANQVRNPLLEFAADEGVFPASGDFQ